MSAATLIRNSRRARQLSQGELSARSGVAQSSLSLIERGTRIPTVETLERILASTGYSLIGIPTRREDAATIAGRISRAEAAGRKDEALRHFIQLNDNLAAEHHELRFALAICEPAPTGTKHWDAALAALVDHYLSQQQLPIPAWATDAKRRLARSWTLNAGRYVVPVPRSLVPRAFLERNVLVDAETLTSY